MADTSGCDAQNWTEKKRGAIQIVFILKYILCFSSEIIPDF